MTTAGRRGFTLLEVMVSLAVMAVVILAVISAAGYHLGLIAGERDDTALTLLGREQLDELAARAVSGSEEGTFAPAHPELSWRSEVLPTDHPAVTKLKVKVKRASDQREVTLVRYLFP